MKHGNRNLRLVVIVWFVIDLLNSHVSKSESGFTNRFVFERRNGINARLSTTPLLLYETTPSGNSTGFKDPVSPTSAFLAKKRMESFHKTLVRECIQKDSTGLGKCLEQVLRDLKPHLSKGIREINLPPLEPLELKNITFQQGSGAVRIASEFTNVKITGLTNFSRSDFRFDAPKRTLGFDLIFPQLSMTGNYAMSGNLFFIMIEGNGDFNLEIGGARALGESSLEIFKNNTYAKANVKNTKVNLTIDLAKVHLTNLFNGDPVLGAFMNNFLSENSQDVFEEVKPQVGAQVGEMLSVLANSILSALSTSSSQFRDILLDLPLSNDD